MFKFAHYNFNVLNLEKSLKFYDEALGLKEVRRKQGEDFTLVFLGDGKSEFVLELTYNHGRTQPYSHGDNEFHLAFITEDFDASYNKHKQMDCICYENKEMGLYFILDPDDFWIEIIPAKK